jgi:predicted secreted protein
MTFLSGFAVYFVIWWVTLFLVLPHGVKSQAEAEDIVSGTDPGAPVDPRLGLKLAANTLIAALVFVAWYAATEYYGLDFNSLPSLFRHD